MPKTTKKKPVQKPQTATKTVARKPAKPPETIDAYLDANARSDEQREALEKLRKQIRAALPKAEECISYGLAAFRQDGRVVLGFGAGAAHCALYPWSNKPTAVFAKELAGFETSKGAIRFQPEKPIPLPLLKKIIKLRVAMNAEKPAPRR